MEEKYCQSCGMPMGETDEHYGNEKDGSKSVDYCSYCYMDGEFSTDDSMEDMIKFCIPEVVKAMPDMTEEKAEIMMKQFFPTLKRWKKA